MMNYDIAVIGGGIAGYCAAIRSQQAGKKTVLISQGQSALHFSSGSIDVLGRLSTGERVEDPFAAILQLQNYPFGSSALPGQADLQQHPYAKVGRSAVEQSLLWFKEMLAAEIQFSHQPDYANHWRITPFGTLKATWLSQPYVYQHRSQANFREIVIVALAGYRDFQPQILKDNLARVADFAGIPIRIATIRLPSVAHDQRHPCERRSLDIAHSLQQASVWSSFCEQLTRMTCADDLVILPAVVGHGDGMTTLAQLQQATQRHFHEVPTMPPSLMGIRLEAALHRIFIQAGGIHLKGDQVLSGHFAGESLAEVYTRNLTDIPVRARHYIMATGSYFSQGLQASRQAIKEPVFGLDVAQMTPRTQWGTHDFIADQPHPFMTFGVSTDAHLHPSYRGQRIDNLYCCGAMLAGYDPVFEGSGGGVAIATAYHAVTQCMSDTLCPADRQEVIS
ncbi:Anaerobic glycerol-3-phosphate dehydrogenase subunit B [Vibrio ruber DSM 16370]|uniref:Anaerobic glycerol-3-phosphate dehydrogenase subunit B n=1 Tax=Vibrio ruber (strain DSM 16370 / JCM 11486 / BCRC 17186 / CECT 7878 / LMG 23124 / VR1) TaxID=1123498 RepID=A0A1R4LNL4_VIBR1|nr:glycerol-3-phosphate dehydrogenase subunit GlpB [Vibrio ruber]SJN58180.1 Anaerobic glycerol-3-phosphate dehydrogenase subunit B [Vibrio ruber DSM 16370]